MAALFANFHEKILPVRVIDRYFTISGESNTYLSGYFGAALMYGTGKHFLLYAPLLTVVYQLTRFVKLSHLSILILWNIASSGLIGKYMVDSRLSQYEVWNQ